VYIIAYGKGMTQRQIAAAQRARDRRLKIDRLRAALNLRDMGTHVGQVTASGAGSSPAEHIAAKFLT